MNRNHVIGRAIRRYASECGDLDLYALGEWFAPRDATPGRVNATKCRHSGTQKKMKSANNSRKKEGLN